MILKEYKIKVLLLKDVSLKEVGKKLGTYLDCVLCTDKNWLENRHYDDSKLSTKYSFNYLFPIASGGVYKKGSIHDFQLRTVNSDVSKILEEKLPLWNDGTFKFLKLNMEMFNMGENSKVIERVFTVTPVLIKNDFGYWRDKESVDFFEKRLRGNMIKKYNFMFEKDLKDIKIFSNYTIDNDKPIAMSYKDVVLLGDKVTLFIDSDEISQKIVKACLVAGLGENNTRLGTGFLNYKYRR